MQPLLIDLAAAADALSSSSSSSGEDAGADTAQQHSPVAARDSRTAADELLQQQHVQLQQQGIVIDVSQPSNSSWRRVLLQLQRDDSADGSERRAVQAAAAGKWLAAHCFGHAQDSAPAAGSPAVAPQQQVASLRCWYEADLHMDMQGTGGWADALLSPLSCQAGQLVPVFGAHCDAGSWGRCWCVIELLMTL